MFDKQDKKLSLIQGFASPSERTTILKIVKEIWNNLDHRLILFN